MKVRSSVSSASRVVALCVAIASLSVAAPSDAKRQKRSAHVAVLDGLPVTDTSWLASGVLGGQRIQLAQEPWRPLFERYLEPYRNHTPEWRGFFFGAYGPAGPTRRAWLPELCWNAARCAEAASSIAAPALAHDAWFGSPELGGDLLLADLAPVGALRSAETWLAEVPAPRLLAVAKQRACPRWKAPRAVTVLRYAGEAMRRPLTECDGAIPSDVIDELSVLARPPGAARPALPLPLEPTGEAGEWADEVRLLEPRLVWAVTEIARAFPGRAIVLMSGYRRDGHSGQHGKGRALDLYVQGVSNTDLYRVCRSLRDTGCGFYPKNVFVHIDTRPYGTSRVGWVDISDPGAPSQYVDGWPDVLAPGSGWLGRN